MMFKILPIDYLQRGQYQPREVFNEETLQELAASIRTHGLIEPLVVREKNTNQYEIIAGERRWRAAMLAGLDEIPCLIGHYTDQQAAGISLIENLQREDLSLIEEANAYLRLLSEFNFTQQEVAILIGKSRSHIANVVRLLQLHASVKDLLKKRELSLGHARLLVGLTANQQIEMVSQLKKKDWSVRELEKNIRTLKNTNTPPRQNTNADIECLQTQIAEQLGAPVEILPQNIGGYIKIKYFDNDTLVGLLERLGLRYD